MDGEKTITHSCEAPEEQRSVQTAAAPDPAEKSSVTSSTSLLRRLSAFVLVGLAALAGLGEAAKHLHEIADVFRDGLELIDPLPPQISIIEARYSGVDHTKFGTDLYEGDVAILASKDVNRPVNSCAAEFLTFVGPHLAKDAGKLKAAYDIPANVRQQIYVYHFTAFDREFRNKATVRLICTATASNRVAVQERQEFTPGETLNK